MKAKKWIREAMRVYWRELGDIFIAWSRKKSERPSRKGSRALEQSIRGGLK